MNSPAQQAAQVQNEGIHAGRFRAGIAARAYDFVIATNRDATGVFLWFSMVRSERHYVHPRNKKMISKTGIGIPKSQRRM
jgi:hypothetical protein